MSFNITAASVTDKGSREINEDSLGIYRNGSNFCFVLCDGLGGHGMGDAASQLTVSVFENRFKTDIKAEKFLSDAFTSSQNALLDEQTIRNARKKMKTTGVALVTSEKNAYIGHIGDSRLYIFQKNKVRCRTLDHSIPQMLALSGEISENEIRNHPDRSTILRVLGVEWEEPMYQLMKPVPLKKCQAFLLCSDGFWELIEENDMCEALSRSGSPEQWLSEMTQIVKTNGAGKNMDNYSAIAVWVTKQ